MGPAGLAAAQRSNERPAAARAASSSTRPGASTATNVWFASTRSALSAPKCATYRACAWSENPAATPPILYGVFSQLRAEVGVGTAYPTSWFPGMYCTGVSSCSANMLLKRAW